MTIAIITGASSGMGREFVRKVIGQDKTPDEIWVIGRRQALLDQWPKQHPSIRFRCLAYDLTDPVDMDKLDRLLADQKPEVEIFVHAAGLGIYGDIAELSMKEQTDMIDLNCRSTAQLTVSILPYLTKDARLIYLASAAAYLPQPGFSVYAASKSFTLSYVRALRAENKKKQWKITAVCPGAVSTDFFRQATKHHPLPAYKKMFMADPKKVVTRAWYDNLHNKEISIYGIGMNAFALASKIIPHRIFLSFL